MMHKIKPAEIYAQWKNPPKAKAEKGGGKRLVSLSGYVPLKDRIEDFMRAGVNLLRTRGGGYYDSDYGDIDDNSPVDPFRAPGVDFAEVSEAARELNERRAMQSRVAKDDSTAGKAKEKTDKMDESTSGSSGKVEKPADKVVTPE